MSRNYGISSIYDSYMYLPASVSNRLWSSKSVNVNGNEDEQDSEEIEIEENPLDESELIQDYKIESLQLYDSGKSN